MSSKKREIDQNKKPPKIGKSPIDEKKKKENNEGIEKVKDTQEKENREKKSNKDIEEKNNDNEDDLKDNEISHKKEEDEINSNKEGKKINNIEVQENTKLLNLDPSPDLSKIEINYNEKEQYLKGMLDVLNMPGSISKGVNNRLKLALKRVEKQIIEEKIKLAEVSFGEVSNISPLQTYELTALSNPKAKVIRKLKQTQDKLQNDIEILNQNQKALLNESFLNVSNSQIENNIRSDQIKKLKEKEEVLIGKLFEIKQQVNRIIDEERKINRKNNIKEFKEKYEIEKDDYTQKVQLYEEQSFILKQNRMNDLSHSKERKLKEIQEHVEYEPRKKKNFIIEQRNRDIELRHKRKKEIDEQMAKMRNYLKEKSKKDINNSLFYQMNNKFITNENRYYEKAKLNKKGSREELTELRRKMRERRIILEKESSDKTHLMKEMWKNRSLIVPAYKKPILKVLKDEEMKLKENKDIERFKKVLIAKERNYAVGRVPKVNYNKKIRKERQNRIFRMEKQGKRLLNI